MGLLEDVGPAKRETPKFERSCTTPWPHPENVRQEELNVLEARMQYPERSDTMMSKAEDADRDPSKAAAKSRVTVAHEKKKVEQHHADHARAGTIIRNADHDRWYMYIRVDHKSLWLDLDDSTTYQMVEGSRFYGAINIEAT